MSRFECSGRSWSGEWLLGGSGVLMRDVEGGGVSGGWGGGARVGVDTGAGAWS